MKKLRGRKGNALRWLAVLAALVVICRMCGLRIFTPAGSLRDAERRLGWAQTEPVWRLWEGAGITLCRHTLSAGEEGLLLSKLSYDPLLGWRCDEFTHLERKAELPLQVHVYDALLREQGNDFKPAEAEREQILFGRIDEDVAGELRLRLTLRCWYGYGDEEELTLVVTPEELLPGDGETLFSALVTCPYTYTIHRIEWLAEERDVTVWESYVPVDYLLGEA